MSCAVNGMNSKPSLIAGTGCGQQNNTQLRNFSDANIHMVKAMKRIFVPTISGSDWQRLLGKPELHWKSGRSAMSAAACWEESEPRLPREISDALEASGDKSLTSLELLVAIPEWEVELPGGDRPSQTDILAITRNELGLVILGVEAKVDELGIEIVIEDMPKVTGDKIRLIEVYLNLIENAIKFIGEQKPHRIHIGAVEKDEMIRCFVRDNGVGIAAEYHDQIFGLFERLNADVDGTGVGLTLVKRIIEVHGGKIWIESEGPGHGSTIWFTLPKSA